MRAAALAVVLLASRALAAEPGAASPVWPEDLGTVSAPDRERVIAARRDSAEDHLRRALLDLAPLPGRDAARARKQLSLAAAGPLTDRWVAAARYALAWIEETDGSVDRARDLYAAIVLEDPFGEAGRRAGTALGRLELRRDQAAQAAAWLQAVVDRGAAPGAAAYREAAVRSVLRAVEDGAGAPAIASRSAGTELREGTALVSTPAGDVIVADRKRGVVVLLERGERPLRSWPLVGVTALAVDPFGRVFVAAGETILRLDGDAPTVVARSGPFGAIAALAVDAAGRFWITDRRGERVGLARADGSEPEIVRAGKGERIEALAWDGRDVVALERGGARIVALVLDGSERTIVTGLAQAPLALAANGAGAIALLDAQGQIAVHSSTGRLIERIDARAAGVARPGAMALGADGSIDCFDGADGRVVRLR